MAARLSDASITNYLRMRQLHVNSELERAAKRKKGGSFTQDQKVSLTDVIPEFRNKDGSVNYQEMYEFMYAAMQPFHDKSARQEFQGWNRSKLCSSRCRTTVRYVSGT